MSRNKTQHAAPETVRELFAQAYYAWTQTLVADLVVAGDYDQREINNVLDMTLDSEVGKQVAVLVHTIEGLRHLGVEPGDMDTIVEAAAHTINVWYFG